MTHYALYNSKFQSYACQSLHTDYKLLVKLFCLYLGENTAQNLLKAIKRFEKLVFKL